MSLCAGGHVYDTGCAVILKPWVQRGEGVGALAEKILPEHGAGVVGIDRQRNDVCLYEVVEKMSAERGFRYGPKLLYGYFGQDPRVVEVFIANFEHLSLRRWFPICRGRKGHKPCLRANG